MSRRVFLILLVSLSSLLPSPGYSQVDVGGFQAAPMASPNPGMTRLPAFAPADNPVFGDDAEAVPGIERAGFSEPVPQGTRFELAETMAQVGDQYILRGDLLGEANLMMSSMFAQLNKVPPESRDQALRELLDYRQQMVETQLLKQAIDRKLKYLAFLRTLPTESDPKKNEERRKKIQQSVSREFDKNLATMLTKVRNGSPEEQQALARQNPPIYLLAVAMKENGVLSRDDPAFEKMLVQHGTSLAKQQQAFMEYILGQQAVGSAIQQPEITHEQLVAYYREHQDEFSIPKRVKWEQLTVSFKRIPNPDAAWAELAAMGNEVLGGAPFWAVAQRKSHDKLAARGGFHDWAPYGDLTISRAVHQVIFEIELNRLSQIIQDEEGLHIVRVLDRQDPHVQPFQEVQDDIKEKLHNERLNKSYSDYVKKLRAETPVITNFDEQAPPNRYARPAPVNDFSR